MKHKIVLRLLFYSLLVIGFNSCEGLIDNCKTCQLNTYEDGVLIIEGTPTEYCDAELAVILATGDETDGNYIIRWDCK